MKGQRVLQAICTVLALLLPSQGFGQVAQAATIVQTQDVAAAHVDGKKTVTVHSKGTGFNPEVDMSLDDTFGSVIGNPYRSDIWPLPGHILPYNASEAQGVTYAVLIGTFATEPGDTIIMSGYSQGGAVAGDAAEVIYLFDLAPGRKLVRVLWADPRLYNTGVEVTMHKYTEDLPFGGYPLLAMRGERETRGQIMTVSYAARYDIISNAPDPVLNPGGFIAGLLGYALGGHDHRNTYQGPVRTVVSDGGMTIVNIIENQHPFVTIGEVLNGDNSMNEAQNRLVHEVAPVGDPGSADQPTPEPLDIAAATADVVGEAVEGEPSFTESTPEAIGDSFGQSTESAVTHVGNVVAEASTYVAPELTDVITEIAEQVATDVGQVIADEATRYLQGLVPAM